LSLSFGSCFFNFIETISLSIGFIIGLQNIMQMSQGPNSLRCTNEDKKDLVLNGVFFCLIF
jgi:hypothetical protein